MKNMMKVKSKKTLAALSVVAVATVLAVSMLIVPALAGEADLQNKHVGIKAKGFAFKRIDNETIKQYPIELELTAELGERNSMRIPVLSANGTVDVNGTFYTIESGAGMVFTGRHIALIRCTGVDADGNEVVLGIGAVYFWWGGNMYAVRAKALLKTADGPMLLLLRGAAKVY
jgi:hypothetical protein